MRESWQKYFMRIAIEVSRRSTCDRKHVGSVIVKDNNILCTGYNGSIRGMPHCDELGHLIENNHCTRVIHSEINAIAQAAKHGIKIDGADIYITTEPCWGCFKVIINAGIKNIYYQNNYKPIDERIWEICDELEIGLLEIKLKEQK